MPMDNERQLRADIVEVGRRLWVRGYTASNDGNISARLDSGQLLMTPASVCKGFMTPEMMVVTDLAGQVLSAAPGRKPSSEMLMHLVVYRHRPDVADVVTTLGSIPLADYGTPSTEELATTVEPFVKAHDALLLANHGALALGKDVLAAYYKVETIEHFARISLV